MVLPPRVGLEHPFILIVNIFINSKVLRLLLKIEVLLGSFRTLLAFSMFSFFLNHAQYQSKDDEGKDSFRFLSTQISQNRNNDSLRSFYINKYLHKAKAQNDYEKASLGFYLKGIYANYPTSLQYYDSALAIGRRRNSEKYFPQINLEYGNSLYREGDYVGAFGRYIEAKSISDSLGLNAISFAANDNIAYLKEISGDYIGAREIYLENKHLLPILFKGKRLVDQKLANYHQLAYACFKTGEKDSTTFYTKLGYNLSNQSSDKTYPSIFSLVEGMNHFEKGQFRVAYDSISKAIISFEKNRDSLNLIFSYLYMGKTNLGLKDSIEGEIFLNKAFKLLKKSPAKIPELSEIFELLSMLNNKKGREKTQLRYLNAFVDYQTRINWEYKDLAPAIITRFDLPELIGEKEAVIDSLEQINNAKSIGLKLLFGLLIIIVLVVVFLWYRNRYYKDKLKEIINKLNDKPEIPPARLQDAEVEEISIEVVNSILERLCIFESEKQFLDSTLTQTKMAKLLNTNSSYLSKIVNNYKNENFSKYLSRLRIEYITKAMVNEPKIRNFTIKAIALEAGFNNSESFSKSFREINGMYPSRFIKQLSKEV